MDSNHWMPAAAMEHLKRRADIIAQIRLFFRQRDVLEVETPAMSHSAVTDIHLHSFKTEFVGPEYVSGRSVSLMTSPEFHMKRLLAAGSGSIYQICKSFRNEETGRHHNPEFTMLEWYRVGFNHHQLMDEMETLLQTVLQCDAAERMTYQEAFQQWTGICPLESTMSQLKNVACEHGFADIAEAETDRDTLLQLLFSMVVEPNIGQQCPAFVYNFPASQAALAKISSEDPRVAERFEVYYCGVELANGFHELDNALEQRQRFEVDNQKRHRMGLEVQPVDEHFIAALNAGLPDCAGVALGIDRLIMIALKCDCLQDVVAFPFSRA
ncbi:Elongation factor P--(R)-beta-lysine ligase [Vibrio aerogenes CECT 7868]|uniref:Elongation factor P--(R)-beta-lysine ligase n=1 Tax=Vibrio aerogenes CECT 7868 TaxID=1216006 RepID=A0A1M5U9E6_9VIBR|nr:elongation factor P--(R)-beta-lysine ligase [Vibrio aerogenes]SHH59538.1 Elongation factor P--(R)-beta-lysine ligase [Vibrio aerogenes CECT 7868]